MAAETPPWATSGGSATYSAEQTRRAVFAAFSRTTANTPGILAGGLIGAGDLLLTAPVSGMSVNVATGEAIIPGNEGGVQGGYYGRVSSTTNLAISTANPSTPRIDTVCATISDSGYTEPTGGSGNQFAIQVVTGTPTSGATLANLNGVAALPGSSLLLGYVLVPGAASNIVSGNILNTAAPARPQPPPLVPVAKSANYTAINGDYVEMTGQHTVTLPTPNAGTMVAVTSVTGTGAAPCTISTPSGAILGPGVAAAATSLLLGDTGAYVVLVADGTNYNIASGQQDTGWLTVANGSMSNSWVNGSPAFGYRLTGNIVRLRGVLVSGSSGTTALTLPSGYRPKQITTQPAEVVGFAAAQVYVDTGGVLQPAYASAGSGVSCDSITFTVD